MNLGLLHWERRVLAAGPPGKSPVFLFLKEVNQLKKKGRKIPRKRPLTFCFISWRHRASFWGFPAGSVVNNPPANAGDMGFDPWVGKIPWRRKWQPTPVFLTGESRGQRSLAGYSPQGCKESDTTEHTEPPSDCERVASPQQWTPHLRAFSREPMAVPIRQLPCPIHR